MKNLLNSRREIRDLTEIKLDTNLYRKVPGLYFLNIVRPIQGTRINQLSGYCDLNTSERSENYDDMADG